MAYDVVRLAERVVNRPTVRHHPHFLGAVVLQQVQKQTGQMQERTIIDGQQRLRYFNPTQSWIEDRVAKGLVEVTCPPEWIHSSCESEG